MDGEGGAADTITFTGTVTLKFRVVCWIEVAVPLVVGALCIESCSVMECQVPLHDAARSGVRPTLTALYTWITKVG